MWTQAAACHLAGSPCPAAFLLLPSHQHHDKHKKERGGRYNDTFEVFVEIFKEAWERIVRICVSFKRKVLEGNKELLKKLSGIHLEIICTLKRKTKKQTNKTEKLIVWRKEFLMLLVTDKSLLFQSFKILSYSALFNSSNLAIKFLSPLPSPNDCDKMLSAISKTQSLWE